MWQPVANPRQFALGLMIVWKCIFYWYIEKCISSWRP